jgi:hypothetical protein
MKNKLFIIASLMLLIGVCWTTSSVACNAITCVDSGYVEPLGRFLGSPFCIYNAWVSAIYGCQYGNPWIFVKDFGTDEVVYNMEMNFHSIDNLCAWFSVGLILKDGHTYSIRFICPGGGYCDIGPVTPDCWE